jgi:arylsulfatase A-like enzyme
MIELDATIGSILKKVDDLGIGNDTTVIYTTRCHVEHLL